MTTGPERIEQRLQASATSFRPGRKGYQRFAMAELGGMPPPVQAIDLDGVRSPLGSAGTLLGPVALLL